MAESSSAAPDWLDVLRETGADLLAQLGPAAETWALRLIGDEQRILNFISQSSSIVLCAILIEMIFPIPRMFRLDSLTQTFGYLGLKVNKPDNQPHEARMAGYLMPLLILLVFFALALVLQIMADADCIISAVAMVVLLNYHTVHHETRLLRKLLLASDKKRARGYISRICLREGHNLSEMGMCKAGCENIASRMQENFAVICWFMAGGFKGALLMKLICVIARAYNRKLRANAQFGRGSSELREVLIYIPSLLYALCLALFNFALSFTTIIDGLHRGARDYPCRSTGMVFGTIGRMTGIRLGGPRYYGEDFVRFADIGGTRNPQVSDLRLILRRCRFATLCFMLCCLVLQTFYLR